MTHFRLKQFAALVWCSGGIVLAFKSWQMFFAAYSLRPFPAVLLTYLVLGVLIGMAKVRYIFQPSCRRNLLRIDGLKQPQIWQAFRTGFLVFLFSMVLFGQWISNYAIGKYYWLLAVGLIDLSLTIALLGSAPVFIKAGLARLR